MPDISNAAKRGGQLLLAFVGLFILFALISSNGASARRQEDTPEPVQQPAPAPAPVSSSPAAGAQGSVMLEVQNIPQLPELPNGCEATALTILLNYWGCNVTKLDVAYTYIPRQDFEWEDEKLYGPSPEKAYAGDPATAMGFYCYEGPVMQGANAALRDEGISAQESNTAPQGTKAAMQAARITGANEEALVDLLQQGSPVLVWVTTDNRPLWTQPESAWVIAETGEVYEPYMNCHAVVLVGFDTENFYMCDPLEQYAAIPRATFMRNFKWAGSRGVTLVAI